MKDLMWRSSSMRVIGACLALCMTLVVMQDPAAAQDDFDDDFIEEPLTGIGAQLGVPTGITVRLQRSSRLSYEFMASLDFDESFFFDANGLFSFGLNDAGWAYYLGPGAFIGFSDEEGDESVALGLTGRAGISYYYTVFEFFGQVTPRFELVNEADAPFGAGVGVRIYF